MGTLAHMPTHGAGKAGSQRKKVLIVDDDKTVRGTVSDALGGDYDCTTAASAEEAIVILEAGGPFDYIFSDVVMGEMDGIAFVDHCRSAGIGVPITVMSGVLEIEVTIRALRAGATDYLTKPFDLRELDAVMKRADDGRRRRYFGEEDASELIWSSAAKGLAVALGVRDNETNGHAARVVHYSLRLGQEMGLDGAQMLALKLGSRLHDIGKIGVPDFVLKKPAKLTEYEWGLMREHPTVGETMARKLGLPEGAARIIGQHHEWWNGSGYPRRISGVEIDLPSRIFSVVDAYDAMTSDRCYRLAQPHDNALAELRAYAGIQFDPDVVEAFARVPPEEWEAIRTDCRDEEVVFVTAANF